MGSVVAHHSFAGTPNLDTVTAMVQAAPHRGRLAGALVHGATVLGISQTADRPDASLASANGVAVAISGVVDNLDEVADGLGDGREARDSMSPAEILVAAYARHGDDLPAKLRGFFSAIVSDG